MYIRRSKQFDRAYDYLDVKIQVKAISALQLFIINPFNPTLNNHALTGNLKGLRSINITGDFRIHYRELSDGKYELVELINIGTHSQLYQ